MDKLVTLTIDGRTVQAPAGTLIIDAAKKAGIVIPVFCYHPKLEPVGMCRMCLVDIGRPAVDRATNQPILNPDGTPKITFGPKLDTACTTPISEGMVVWGATEKVMAARKSMLEFLLTSHPLDCPVCDKGGECPLQNQTIAFGPGNSRFIYDEKIHLRKKLPLGDLIMLDRERCIQCARCIRFQDQVVDEPVIGFYERGRALEIVSYSEPGFDSIFSGNTTDICPVGALTTSDFRFGARPWEMKPKASICTQCPVGCNINYEVRREAGSGGRVVIKRVLPRQNEAVNEIWVCDKGRFTYHYAESTRRLTRPLVRRDGELVPASWEEALQTAADKMRTAGSNLVTLTGSRLLNEDLFALKQLNQATRGKIFHYSRMGGGDWVNRVGMPPGSNLGSLGKDDAILVFASELHEEAPIWWLRVKQAAERGANLIVISARKTRLDKYATHSLKYRFGEEEAALREILAGESETAKAFKTAQNGVIFLGSDGMGASQVKAAAALSAEILVKTDHFGKPNNGLVIVWQAANDMGAAHMGLGTSPSLASDLGEAMGVYIAGADPAGDDPDLSDGIQRAGFVIVQDMFLSETARLADVVFPIQAVMEREGSLVSGERRVQRVYCAVPEQEGTRSDYAVTAEIAARLDIKLDLSSPGHIFDLMAQTEKSFAGMNTARLAEVTPQWPDVGDKDDYFGGTSSKNTKGLGVVPELLHEPVNPRDAARFPTGVTLQYGEWLAVPITSVYHQDVYVAATELLKNRIPKDAFSMHPVDAEALGVDAGARLTLQWGIHSYEASLAIDPDQPQGVILVRRDMGVPLHRPTAVRCTPAAQTSNSNR